MAGLLPDNSLQHCCSPGLSLLPTSLRLLERLHGSSSAPALVVTLRNLDSSGTGPHRQGQRNGGPCGTLCILWANASAIKVTKQIRHSEVEDLSALSLLLEADAELCGNVHRQLGNLQRGGACAAPITVPYQPHRLPFRSDGKRAGMSVAEPYQVSFLPCIVEAEDSTAPVSLRCCFPWANSRSPTRKRDIGSASCLPGSIEAGKPLPALLLHFNPARTSPQEPSIPTTLSMPFHTPSAPAATTDAPIGPSSDSHLLFSSLSTYSSPAHISNQPAKRAAPPRQSAENAEVVAAVLVDTSTAATASPANTCAAAASCTPPANPEPDVSGWWRQSCLVLSALPVSVTVFSRDDGQVLFQNAASIEFFGDRCKAASAATTTATGATTTVAQLPPDGGNRIRNSTATTVVTITTTSTTVAAASANGGARSLKAGGGSLLSRMISSGSFICRSKKRPVALVSAAGGAAPAAATAAARTSGAAADGDSGYNDGDRGAWTLPTMVTPEGGVSGGGGSGGYGVVEIYEGSGDDSGSGGGVGQVGGLILAELFCMEPGKLMQMWSATAAEGGVWQGIVRVPKSLNADLVSSVAPPEAGVLLAAAAATPPAAAPQEDGEAPCMPAVPVAVPAPDTVATEVAASGAAVAACRTTQHQDHQQQQQQRHQTLSSEGPAAGAAAVASAGSWEQESLLMALARSPGSPPALPSVLRLALLTGTIPAATATAAAALAAAGSSEPDQQPAQEQRPAELMRLQSTAPGMLAGGALYGDGAKQVVTLASPTLPSPPTAAGTAGCVAASVGASSSAPSSAAIARCAKLAVPVIDDGASRGGRATLVVGAGAAASNPAAAIAGRSVTTVGTGVGGKEALAQRPASGPHEPQARGGAGPSSGSRKRVLMSPLRSFRSFTADVRMRISTGWGAKSSPTGQSPPPPQQQQGQLQQGQQDLLLQQNLQQLRQRLMLNNGGLGRGGEVVRAGGGGGVAGVTGRAMSMTVGTTGGLRDAAAGVGPAQQQPQQQPRSATATNRQLSARRRGPLKQWSSVNTLSTSTWQVAFEHPDMVVGSGNSFASNRPSTTNNMTCDGAAVAANGDRVPAGAAGGGVNMPPTMARRKTTSLIAFPTPDVSTAAAEAAEADDMLPLGYIVADSSYDWNGGGGGGGTSATSPRAAADCSDPATDKLTALPSNTLFATAYSSRAAGVGGGGALGASGFTVDSYFLSFDNNGAAGGGGNGGAAASAAVVTHGGNGTGEGSAHGAPPAPLHNASPSAANRSQVSHTAELSRFSRRFSMDSNLTAALAPNAPAQECGGGGFARGASGGCSGSVTVNGMPMAPAVSSRVVAFAASLRNAPVLPKSTATASGASNLRPYASRSHAQFMQMRVGSERRLLTEASFSAPGPRSASMTAATGGSSLRAAAASTASVGIGGVGVGRQGSGNSHLRPASRGLLLSSRHSAADAEGYNGGGRITLTEGSVVVQQVDERANSRAGHSRTPNGFNSGNGGGARGSTGLTDTSVSGGTLEAALVDDLTAAGFQSLDGILEGILEGEHETHGSSVRHNVEERPMGHAVTPSAGCNVPNADHGPISCTNVAGRSEHEVVGFEETDEGGAVSASSHLMECWHEVVASCMVLTPGSGTSGASSSSSAASPPRLALVLMQRDVSAKVVAERHVARVSETEHRLLEQIFPRHVLQYIMEEADCGQPPFITAASSVASPQQQEQCQYPDDQQQQQQQQLSSPAGSAGSASAAANQASPPMAANWRPHIRDCNRLATWHPKVTVLFADIQGFTPMCKVLPPRVVMSFLNTLFTRFDAMLDEYGVYKVETIGDCYMVAGGLIREDEDGMSAVQGAGQVDPDQVANVVGFAKAMLSAASRVVLPTSGQPVRVRVGVHCGPVVSGVVGTRMPRFCLFGDTVNTASRMESTGVPGAVHASQEAWDMLRQRDPAAAEGWEPTGGIEVKGKGLMRTYVWTPPESQPPSSEAPSATAPSTTTEPSAAGAAATAVTATSAAPASGWVATTTTTTAAVAASATLFTPERGPLPPAGATTATTATTTAKVADGTAHAASTGSSSSRSSFGRIPTPLAGALQHPPLPVLGSAWRPFVAAAQLRAQLDTATSTTSGSSRATAVATSGSMGGGSGCGGLAQVGCGRLTLPPASLAAMLAAGVGVGGGAVVASGGWYDSGSAPAAAGASGADAVGSGGGGGGGGGGANGDAIIDQPSVVGMSDTSSKLRWSSRYAEFVRGEASGPAGPWEEGEAAAAAGAASGSNAAAADSGADHVVSGGGFTGPPRGRVAELKGSVMRNVRHSGGSLPVSGGGGGRGVVHVSSASLDAGDAGLSSDCSSVALAEVLGLGE
ncbi:hypothetical protein Agub_g13438, partial [Astrephomene gubernaculifera]